MINTNMCISIIRGINNIGSCRYKWVKINNSGVISECALISYITKTCGSKIKEIIGGIKNGSIKRTNKIIIINKNTRTINISIYIKMISWICFINTYKTFIIINRFGIIITIPFSKIICLIRKKSCWKFFVTNIKITS